MDKEFIDTPITTRSAAELCRALARLYDAQDGGRAKALAATLREYADVLEPHGHSDRALLAAWSLSVHAHQTTDPALLGARTSRVLTLAEWIGLAGGVPRDLGPADYAAAESVSRALSDAWAERSAAAPEDRRLAAMAATAAREAQAVAQ